MSGTVQDETTPDSSTRSKMTQEERRQYLKRLYKLASDHYTPEEKEAYLNKLYAEEADASMIRAAAMQVYRARKSKEKQQSHFKEHSPASVASPLETKTPMKMLKDSFSQLFSCTDLKVVDDDGNSVAREDSAWFCGVDEKYLREIENEIVEKHFMGPREKTMDNSSQSNAQDAKPLKQRSRMKVGNNVMKYEASSLDKYLESNGVGDDRDFPSYEFGDGDDVNDAAFLSSMKRTHVNQNKNVLPRELFFNEGLNNDSAAPHTIYISPDPVEQDAPVTTISTSKLATKDGTKTIVIVPSSPKKRKSKSKTNKGQQQHYDNDIPFDERNKIKTDRMNNLVESVKNLPFDEASYTIAYNAEEFVDHLANESPENHDFLILEHDVEASQRQGLTVEELALDVEYQYRR